VIEQALNIYIKNVAKETTNSGHSFMVSRLAAARLALLVSPESVEPYLSLEFEGKSCGQVADALTGEEAPKTGDWSQPYELQLLLSLMANTREGKYLEAELMSQADLFREYFLSLVKDNKKVYIVDTGVFGSIGHFLQSSFPNIEVNSLLLFKANYKKIILRSQSSPVGLVSSDNIYFPWKPRSTWRLYWPFIEAFFEPDLPSVRTFRREGNDKIISNLQVENWQARLSPTPNTIVAGAFDYVAQLQAESVSDVLKKSQQSWLALRKKIVFPTAIDIELLGIKERGLDFGFNDKVSFLQTSSSQDFCEKIQNVRESVWPEGEVRKLFPVIGSVILFCMEVYRYFKVVLDIFRRENRN
tara:strand:+ start:3181 stop:4251 length:1071 start_codon:yes stop_codon:yes gene_type:complete